MKDSYDSAVCQFVSSDGCAEGKLRDLGISGEGIQTPRMGGPLKHGELQTRLTVALSGGQAYITVSAGSR